jgi:hypothetical protein
MIRILYILSIKNITIILLIRNIVLNILTYNFIDLTSSLKEFGFAIDGFA